MSKILVTGANGLLASNVIIELLKRGYFVTGLLRKSSNFQLEKHPNLKLVEADICDENSVNKALKDCDSVIHLAAITDQSLLNYSDYQKVNASATKLLLNLSVDNVIKRFVYVSSANTFGYGFDENIENETLSIKKPFTKSLYAKSKLEGQNIILGFKNKMKTVVVNPTFMLGAYDSKPSSGRIIFMGYKKKIIFFPPGGKNFINVKDAAIGTINALEYGTNGESYILANENLTYKAFFQKLSTSTRYTPVFIKLPKILLLIIGLFGELLRLFRIRSSISLTNMQILCINNYYNNKKAKKELGLDFKPIETAIEDSINWFIKKGML